MAKASFEEREFLVQRIDGARHAFIEAFMEKFKSKIPPMLIYNRASYLWAEREHQQEIYNKELAKRNALNHTVMVPKQIVPKSARGITTTGSAFPDVGELIVKQNNLIAEMVCLQKEQNKYLSGLLENQAQILSTLQSQLTLFNSLSKGTATDDETDTKGNNS
jgi:hypothetical protein